MHQWLTSQLCASSTRAASATLRAGRRSEPDRPAKSLIADSVVENVVDGDGTRTDSVTMTESDCAGPGTSASSGVGIDSGAGGGWSVDASEVVVADMS